MASCTGVPGTRTWGYRAIRETTSSMRSRRTEINPVFRTRHQVYTPCVWAALGMVLLTMAGAEERPAQGVDKTLTAQLVRTGLYMISGGGGNSLLRLSANGFILV